MDPNLAQLAQCLRASMDPAHNKAAEAQLSLLDNTPQYPLMLLRLVSEASLDSVTRQGAAVTFKNFVRKHWRKEAEVSIEDREAVKTHIVSLLLSAPPLLQKQLSDALSIISDADFPAKWPTLLPEMLQKMASGDFAIIKGVLGTLHSIFKRYRGLYKNNNVMTEQKYVLNLLGEPLLKLYQATADAVVNPAATANPPVLVLCFESLLLITKIFFSLSFIDLPEQFENHLKEWAELFVRFLTFTPPPIRELIPVDNEKAGVVVKLQTAICSIAVLYTEKYDLRELPLNVSGHLAARHQLGTRGAQRSTSIAFINQVSLNQKTSKTILGNQAALQSICQHIIVPNLEFRQADEDLFEEDPQEYIKRDIEGSDSDTRRRAACELVRGLRKDHEAEVTAILGGHIQQLFAAYQADPKKNWKLKDASLYLITALSVSSGTEGQGVIQANSAINILDVFSSAVLPELQNKHHPVLQADALKFATTFRRQIPKENGPGMFSLFGELLASPNVVVHSYAALCIERFLTLTDDTIPRYTKLEIAPHLGTYVTAFFKQLATKDSEHNEYIMRGLARVLLVAKEDTAPMATQLMQGLCQILVRNAENQVNANFTHFLFEAMGATIKGVCTAHPAHVASFEQALIQPFQVIITKDLADLSIYMYQLLALCLELGPAGEISAFYTQLFPTLLHADTWLKAKTSIPALVRLLQAYIRKAGPHIGASTNTQMSRS